MRNAELLRRNFFWFMDKVKKGKVKNHYQDIKYIIENPLHPKVMAKKDDSLINILDHAVHSTDFYKKYREYSSIHDFPIIDKNIIRDQFNGFQAASYIDEPKQEVFTSGSTGTPFRLFHDMSKRDRNTADNIYFSERGGYTLGNELTYFRLWKTYGKKSFLTNKIKNIIPVDVFSLKENHVIEDILDKLRKNKSTMSWLGYVSAIEKICRYMDEKNSSPLPGKLVSVITISEKLNDYTRDAMKKYFGINPISRYSNTENGIIAQEIHTEEDGFIINTASYYVEILDIETNTPVENGAIGKIVVTDLYNYCMPVIRYDTGDIGAKHMIDGKEILCRIEGRKMDVLTDTKGEAIYSNIMYVANHYQELKQCQLIQKDHGVYLFKINIEGVFQREAEFIKKYRDFLGADATISVEYVDEIPLLDSGKRRFMVNEMKN
ncbi:CoF synthetase [Aquimarina sp. TRL1]|nr:CoF synthetase [Aquimarina sp. TRL1]